MEDCSIFHSITYFNIDDSKRSIFAIWFIIVPILKSHLHQPTFTKFLWCAHRSLPDISIQCGIVCNLGNWKAITAISYPDILTAIPSNSVVTHPIVGLSFSYYYTLCHKQRLLLVHTQPWIRTQRKITNFWFIKIIFRHIRYMADTAHHIPSLSMFHLQLLFVVQKYWWIHQKFVSRRHFRHYYCNHHKLSVATFCFDGHVSMKFIDQRTDTANQIFFHSPFFACYAFVSSESGKCEYLLERNRPKSPLFG